MKIRLFSWKTFFYFNEKDLKINNISTKIIQIQICIIDRTILFILKNKILKYYNDL